MLSENIGSASTKQYTIEGFGEAASQQTFSRDQAGAKAGPRPSPRDVAAAAATGSATPQRAAAAQENVTIAKYFKDKYNLNLRYPRYQVVRLKGNEFVPMEALEVSYIGSGPSSCSTDAITSQQLLPGTGIPPTRLTP